jgi:gluconate 2-dehydrogenase gamma chain
MIEKDESRRTFLKGAVAGAGAAATVSFVPEALAQNRATPQPMQMEPNGAGHGAFFNDEESATIAAFTERLMPGAPGMPGARDADVPNYIDLALAGAYADLQEFYRHGLNQLDAYCRATYSRAFARLEPKQQDDIIAALETGKATGFAWPRAQEFFNTIRIHTMEGMFADPIYGGNKDFAGWRLVGFPGAQPFFSKDEIQGKQAFTRAPMMGLKAQAKSPARRS